MASQRELFGGALGIEEQEPDIVQLLRIYSRKNKTLAWCSGGAVLGCDINILEGHCDDFGVIFSDYVPMSMREKK